MKRLGDSAVEKQGAVIAEHITVSALHVLPDGIATPFVPCIMGSAY